MSFDWGIKSKESYLWDNTLKLFEVSGESAKKFVDPFFVVANDYIKNYLDFIDVKNNFMTYDSSDQDEEQFGLLNQYEKYLIKTKSKINYYQDQINQANKGMLLMDPIWYFFINEGMENYVPWMDRHITSFTGKDDWSFIINNENSISGIFIPFLIAGIIVLYVTQAMLVDLAKTAEVIQAENDYNKNVLELIKMNKPEEIEKLKKPPKKDEIELYIPLVSETGKAVVNVSEGAKNVMTGFGESFKYIVPIGAILAYFMFTKK